MTEQVTEMAEEEAAPEQIADGRNQKTGAMSRALGAGKRAAGRVAGAAKSAVSAIVPSTVSTDRPYVTPEQMYQIARRFTEKVFEDKSLTEKLLASKLIVQFKYYDERWGGEEPEVTADCAGDRIIIHTGPCNAIPTLTMRMHADTAHKFWRQKVNLMAAITRGEISARGPVAKAMRLLPAIRPGYAYYRETLEEMGLTELLNYPPEEPEKKPETGSPPLTEPGGRL